MLKQRHHWLKLLDPSSCEIIKQESQRRYSAEDLSQSQALKTWAFHFMAKSPSPSWVVYKGGNYYERDLILSYLHLTARSVHDTLLSDIRLTCRLISSHYLLLL